LLSANAGRRIPAAQPGSAVSLHLIRTFDPAEAALATAALEVLDAERPVRVPLTSI